jgi:hypothetical protein
MFVFPTVEKVLDKKSKDEFVKFGRTCDYSKKQLLLIRCAYLCTIAAAPSALCISAITLPETTWNKSVGGRKSSARRDALDAAIR